MQNEKKLQEELLSVKRDREEKLLASQRRFDEEREKTRMKLFSTESMLKESDNRRQMLIYEHEKEKTRWNIENGQLAALQNEYLEQIDKLNRKVDNLHRENERLLNDIRQLKRNTTTNSLAHSHFAKKDTFYGGERNSILKSDIEFRRSPGGENTSGDFQDNFFSGLDRFNSEEK